MRAQQSPSKAFSVHQWPASSLAYYIGTLPHSRGPHRFWLEPLLAGQAATAALFLQLLGAGPNVVRLEAAAAADVADPEIVGLTGEPVHVVSILPMDPVNMSPLFAFELTQAVPQRVCSNDRAL